MPADEEARLAHDLQGILRLVEQLAAADVAHLRPMAHPHDVAASLRVDRVTESDRLSALETIAPAMESGLYLVPKVIE